MIIPIIFVALGILLYFKQKTDIRREERRERQEERMETLLKSLQKKKEANENTAT